MSSRLDKAIKDFIQILREAGNKGTSPLDAQAEVLRIDEDGTAWVHLPGGVDETPVKLTINAEVGDKVYVRLSGGRAWITGNQTAPPTDDKTAIVAKRLANLAGNRAKTAQKTADQAQVVADSALKGTRENAAQMAKMVLDFNGDIENLQDQIDGNISTWFYDVDPDMGLPPATDWDTDEKKDAHLGDIYYNTVKGYAWRFMKSGSTYSWERITDTDVTKALKDAAKAQDTADSKRRVFYNTPTVPYDAGDLWVQGSGGDILRCAQAKTSTGSYDRNDWVLASKYTDDSALTTWIEGDFATTIQGLEDGLADAKVETYYQTTDPSTGWSDTQKSEHKGDLWYNSTASVQKYYRWSGTAWQELTATPPQAVFDSIDKKATIYTGTTTPTNPSSGDLWFKGADEPILTYVNNSWVEYNKYTDDSTLNAWLTNTYAVDKTNLQNQIDGKAETWYQATDPSLDWSAADKPNHEGDLWYNTSDNTTWYYTGSAWSQQSIPTSVFNNINGKANIFVGSTAPENPKTGDLWLESASSDILTYVDGSWVKYNKYTDDTKAEQAIGDAANAQTAAENAAKVATNYMEYDSTNGLIVGNKTGGSFVGSRAQVLPDSFNILDTDGTKLASFGETTVIGDTDKANLYLTYNELYMEDKDDKVFFKVGDYRNSTGVATLTYTDTRSVNVSAGRVYVALSIPAKIESVISVVVEGTTISEDNYRFSIIDDILDGEVVDHTTSMWVEGLTYGEGDKVEVEVTYTTKSPYSYYVFGLPDKSLIPGRFSSSEGWCTRASGEYTHAEGKRSLASGYASHAEGSSYAYGYMSHAEGISTANGTYSHAEGNSTTGKDAKFSHAEGDNTVAGSESQHVSGAFNIIDNDGKYAFIIGNGSGLSSRSNAMTVDWDGVPTFYGMAGEIKMWAGDTIPNGWLLCDGSEVSKTDYPELYAAIGNLWGTPNSSSNFKLPNLAGKAPVGYDPTDIDFNPVGHTGGEKTHKLTIDEMPAHTHSRNYYSADWCSNGGKSGYHGNEAGSKRNTGSTGRNVAHNNLQPYAVVKYIICAI